MEEEIFRRLLSIDQTIAVDQYYYAFKAGATPTKNCIYKPLVDIHYILPNNSFETDIITGPISFSRVLQYFINDTKLPDRFFDKCIYQHFQMLK